MSEEDIIDSELADAKGRPDVQHPSNTFGEVGVEARLLDNIASYARTALDDYAGLPDTEQAKIRSTLAPSVNAGLVAYAVERLDEIINVLNPAENTRESYAATLTMLGRQLAERADTIEQNELEYEEHDDDTKQAYTEAHTALLQALDRLDEAIDALATTEA